MGKHGTPRSMLRGLRSRRLLVVGLATLSVVVFGSTALAMVANDRAAQQSTPEMLADDSEVEMGEGTQTPLDPELLAAAEERRDEAAEAGQRGAQDAVDAAASDVPSSTPSEDEDSDGAGGDGDREAQSSGGSRDDGGGGQRGSCNVAFYSSWGETDSGERFDDHALTAAHPTLAFGTRVQITSRRTRESVTVRVNDRDPSAGDCFALTVAAYQQISGWNGHGATRADWEVVGS